MNNCEFWEIGFFAIWGIDGIYEMLTFVFNIVFSENYEFWKIVNLEIMANC